MCAFPNESFHVVAGRANSAPKASGASCTRPFTYRRCTTCLLAYRVPPRMERAGRERRVAEDGGGGARVVGDVSLN